MRIRSFVLLICLLFSSEVKASVSLNSNITRICVQRHFFLKKAESMMHIPLPLFLKIKFRTPYIFDLDFEQNFDIAFVRDTSKNDYTSFISRSILQVSKRKLIKTIYERVVFCFDFSIPFFFFNVALLTKDAGEFKFFHAPEYEYKEGERKKRERSFVFSSFISSFKQQRCHFLRNYRDYGFIILDTRIKPIDNILACLYCFVSFFSYFFDIMVCSYLSCCIKIPLRSVFWFFLLHRYFSLNKKIKELYGDVNVNSLEKVDNKKSEECKRDSCKNVLIQQILSIFNFSIKIFDKEEIEE